MARYTTIIKSKMGTGSLMDCYYVDDGDGRVVAAVVPMQHNLKAAEFAQVLRRAADWFDQIAEGKVEVINDGRELR